MMYDAVIVGGGLVGATLALALADHGYKIAIVEAQAPQTTLTDTLDLRVVALSLASIQWLKHAGIWSGLDTSRIGTFKHMRVFDGLQDKAFTLTADSIHQSRMGVIVENKQMLSAAHTRLLSHPHVTTYFQQAVKQLERSDHTVSVNLTDETLTAHLLLAADGGHSAIRRMLNIDVQQHAYHQKATVGYVRTEKPHQNTAYQRFTRTGPFALLPMHDPHVCSFVFSHPSSQPLEADLTSALDCLGKLTLCSDTGSFPLQMRHAYEYGHPGVILLGDAIHTIHPLAGQGVNLGFMDAGCLFDMLHRTDVSQWHSPLLLKRYQRQRHWHNEIMAKSMTLIQRFYDTQVKPVQWLRGWGAQIIDGQSLIQKPIVQAATGLNAHVPACMQPNSEAVF